MTPPKTLSIELEEILIEFLADCNSGLFLPEEEPKVTKALAAINQKFEEAIEGNATSNHFSDHEFNAGYNHHVNQARQRWYGSEGTGS